ncbi:MAG TPA: DegT/DnrJ/EryC1/StrS family aminotransferase [Solirubrobacterales bacterium]
MIESRTLSAEELESIRHLIPDPEPTLVAPSAIDGEPVPEGTLYVSEPLLDGNEARYLAECVSGNWISSAGGFVTRFEREFATAMGCEHGVACSSGTAALHLALAAAGIAAGDEVMLPAFTMISTANAVRYLGAEPVLIDSEPETGNLDVELLAAKLGPRTRAIVPVHIYGHPVEMGPLREFAERNGLAVIEDAAEAHGATYGGEPAGSLGEVAAFSFYANKIITTGEGGMVTTNDGAIAARARELRDLSFSHERHFWHRSVAFNYRMSNLQAAVGVAQTERLTELVDARRENRRRYAEGLAGIPGIGLPVERPGVRNVFWMFALTIGDEFGCSRDELRRRLAARGIETRTFFVPIHLQPAYFHRHRGQSYPVAEELGRTGLYLPSGSGLTEPEIAYVVREVARARG